MVSESDEECIYKQEKKAPDYRFIGTIILFEIITFICIATITTYADAVESDGAGTVSRYYAMYQDVNVMIFVGFGFLMSFLRKNMFNSIGLTFLIGVMSIQLGICFGDIIHNVLSGHEIFEVLTLPTLIKGDFAAGAVLISFGAVVGRVSHLQVLWMLFFELIFYQINSWVGEEHWKAVDMGGSMFVHMFGCYFGLAFSWILGPPKETKDEKSVYKSDMFAMIGTLFLWMFWPSFNGALAGELTHAQERVVINTAFALCSSCAWAFVFSHWSEGRLDMVHIQNATLAGGVAVGSSSDLVIGPWAAMVIGLVAGVMSTAGYVYLTPKLNACGLYDVCGIHNLHGMPGFLGAIAGAISATMADGDHYGENINIVFGAMAGGRTATEQGQIQAAALGMTLVISIFGGLITGFIVTSVCHEKKKNLFSDYDEWEVPVEQFASEMRGIKESDELQMKSEIMMEPVHTYAPVAPEKGDIEV